MFTCKDCLERKMGCHGSCEKYKQERAEHDKRIAQEKAQKEIIRYEIDTRNRVSLGYVRKRRRHGHR